MSDRLIFVSCGQRTPGEKQLGLGVKAAIDSHEGFSAYFADAVQSLTTLGNHVFDALRRCTGAVAFLHSRGNGSSSMWINQELAVLAYRQFFESAEIPILVFKEDSVRLEGAMSAFIVNAKPLIDEEAVIAEVSTWLTDKAAKGRSDEHMVFAQKWALLQAVDRTVLKALIEEGGYSVKETSIRRRLIESHGLERYEASNALRTRRLALSQANLIQLRRNSHDGDEISLHPAWEWNVRHEISKA
ncbi:MAG: hypothetical protein LLG20_14585 [Acidobacteriales bacterium]|nr:hypothetical protein [Terriglobales bacterium]